MKHLFTALLFLCCVGTATAHDFNVDGIYYSITDATNKTVEVTYKGKYYTDYSNEYTGSVTIPESVTYNGNTYSVTSIGNSAFSSCDGLTSIVIPNSVTSIGSYAFEGCTWLTSITIPNSVTSIGNYAFSGCTGLTSIEIPNSVTSIGEWAFSGCSGLTSVEIPNSVTSIGDLAFRNCTGLTSITIPNSVTSIGWAAFRGTAWYNNQPDGVVYAGKVLYEYKGTMPSNTSIIIKDGILGIADRAFYNCTGLTSIEIPNSVTSIGIGAFAGCSGLTSIVVDGNNTKYDSREDCNAIIETETNTLVSGCKNTVIPSSVTSIGEDAFAYCYGLTSVEIPNSVTSIGDYAFTYCSGLTSVEIPNSVTSIGDYAFSNCSGLKSVVIPNSVTSIGEWAFSGCTGLTSVEIPNSVTSIGDYAFAYCYGLTSIEIPNSVTSIGDYAFDGTVWYNNQPDGVVYAGKMLYKYKGTMPSNTSISIKDGTLGIAGFAFEDCTGLTSITIPNSVTNIGIGAFSGCSGLTSIVVDGNNTKYDSREDCNAIIETETNTLVSGCKNTVIPSGVTSIGEWAFSGCSGLTSITIPNSVTSIGWYAFSGCSGLTSVVIPNSVTSIGSNAFYECTGLTSITSLIHDESLFAINSYVFNKIDKTVCTLYVPVGTKETYASTDGWKDFVNIVEKDFTGIDEVLDEVKAEPTVDASQSGKVKTIYDLNGRAVENPSKGIYIIDGKKVLIK